MGHPLGDFELQLRARVDQILDAARMREAPLEEVRRELDALAQTALPHVRPNADYYGDAAWGARMTTTLQELAETQSREYLRRRGIVVPDISAPVSASPAPQTKKPGSVFANAKATAKVQPWKQNAETYDRSYTFKCIHCGAPQQVELNFECRFCHKPINE